MGRNEPLDSGNRSNSPLWENPPPPPNINKEPPDKSFIAAAFLDVPYDTHSEAQKLDIYLPAGGHKPYPVIVSLHGGGWLIGDKRWGIAELAEPLLAKGYAVVGVNYRHSDEAIFPAQIYDAKAAIRWLRANAAKYNFNTEKIVASGASAGGYLSALLGTSAHVKELEDPSLGNPGQSSRVSAAIVWYGPIDFLQLDAQHEQLGHSHKLMRHNSPNSAESRLLGGPITELPEKCMAANPMRYIRADNPPFYIQHGKADEAVPYLQSVNLAEALKAVIGANKVRLELIENAGHLDPIHLSPPYMRKVLDFLDRKG